MTANETTDEKPPINTDEWTPNQKAQVLRTLFKESVGLIELNEEKGIGMLPFDETVDPGCTTALQITPFTLFKPQRLIIFEPVTETFVTEHYADYKTVTRGHLWWKKTAEERTAQRSETKLVTHKISRSSWLIVGGYVGQKAIWPSRAAQPGDVFGIENALTFDAPVCEPGLALTLQVRNLTDRRARFSAVMVGKFIDENKKREKLIASESEEIRS
jgi:hypothetical protein